MRCVNPKLLAGIVAAGVAVALLVPGLGRSIGPLLILAACPLSMVAMMFMMGRGSRKAGDDAAAIGAHPVHQRDVELAELRERLARLEAHDPSTRGRV